METLVVVDQPKNQYYCTRSNSQVHAPFGYSSPSRDFRGINCRTFQSGTGLLPRPLKSQGSLRTPSPKKAVFLSPDNDKLRGRTGHKDTTPIAISGKGRGKGRNFGEDVPRGSFSLSELWAGPTYSNSPPPSSLPIPKFSVRPKRTVSLELPDLSPEIEMRPRPVAKSAPVSPSREHSPSTRGFFGKADLAATKTLCRILNLNINGE